MYITIHDETLSRIICLTKAGGLILSFLWKGHNKRLWGNTIDKTMTIRNRTKPGEIRYLKLGSVCNFNLIHIATVVYSPEPLGTYSMM